MSFYISKLHLVTTGVVVSTVIFKDEEKVDEKFAGRGVLLVKGYGVLNSVYIKW